MKFFNLSLVMLLLCSSTFLFAQEPHTSLNSLDKVSTSLPDKPLMSESIYRITGETDVDVLMNKTNTQDFKLSKDNINKYFRSLKPNRTVEDSPSPVSVISGENFLDEGVVSVSQLSNLYIGSFKNKFDGNDNGSTGLNGINLRGGVNIIRGLGVRALIHLNNQTFKSEQGDEKYKDRNSVYGLEVVKPLVIGNHALNVYAGFSLGTDKDITEIGGNENESKNDLTIFGGGVELPISLGGSSAFFTPMISYVLENGEYDNGEYDYNSLQITGSMYSFFTCAMFDPCDKDGLGLNNGNYDQGNSCLGSNAGFNLEIGKETDKYEYGGYSGENKTNNTHTGLQFDYGYYVIDGLAVRGIFDYAGETIKDDDSDAKQTFTNLNYGIGVNYNLPLEGKLNNIYIRADYTLGKEKDKFENGTTSETEHDLSTINAGVGYNIFIIDGVAISPFLGYQANGRDNGSENDWNGINFGIGINNYFSLF